MTGSRLARTLGDVLAAGRRRFVGRVSEIELFRMALESAQPSFSVLYLYGPGGIGKTWLLDVLAELAAGAGARVVRLDGRELSLSPRAVLDALADVPDRPGREEDLAGAAVVVLVDSYERLAGLDDWFRGDLLPRLPALAVTVIAGRDRPSPMWRSDPAWASLLRVVSLRNLDPQECYEYLRARRIDPAEHARLVQITHGHPLGLSLVADVVSRGGDAAADPLSPDLVGTLVRQFAGVVPGGLHRRALGVCALARVSTEALLRDALGMDDAGELFAWLRGLSFVESGRGGLCPHDLARDVLDADLRWRDPEGYKQVFRAVRGHVHRRLETTRGMEQQRALFDEKFLFRNLPSILSPLEWETWGQHYPEPARLQDQEVIVGMARSREGQESAVIARRWLARQPEGVFVLRRPGGSVRGFVVLLDLTRASAEDLAADPGARAAWDFAQRHAPSRPGEAVTLCRFVIDAEAYQDPSPTMNATPILAMQRYLTTPNLAWDFVALAEPERWDAYFEAADLPRARGADFAVGGHGYGLFAHDFRQVPVGAWLELVTDRALAQDFTLPPEKPPQPLVQSQQEFTEAARQALRDLHRPDLLARNPLQRTRLIRDRAGNREPGPALLKDTIRDAVGSLRVHPRDDKLYRAVERTYLRPAGTQEAAAAGLGLPFSTYRRHLAQGVERVVSWLWDLEVYGDTEHR